MSQQTPQPKSIEPIKLKTIPVASAREHTKHWRDFVKKIRKDDACHLSRGAFISIDDINDIITNYGNMSLIGVRAYFALTEPAEDNDNFKTLGFAKILIVPVIAQEGSLNGKDIVHFPVDEPGKHDISAVYDFTKPCPDCCDEDSELYDDKAPDL